MRFTVVWLRSAERDLAQLWLEAHDRNSVSGAADEIDRRLKDDPDEEGESRPDGGRILVVEPLGVAFAVIEDDRTAYVQHVWRER